MAGTPIQIFLPPPINSDTAKLIGETDYRASEIIAMPETTQVKCKVCKGMTEHAYYILEIANGDVVSERKNIFVCLNDGNTTFSTIKG